MLLKRIRIGMIHAAVAITLVPINSTLNRILIEDLGIAATLVVLLFSPPYLFSFIQVAIGSFSDRHPVLGLRRTPYILAGLLLCVIGLMLAAQMAVLLPQNFWLGLGLGVLTFGAWGMGFNLATVSYFSLASEISGEDGHSKTTATMFFIMIVSIIVTAASLSRMLVDYSPERLQTAFSSVAIAALGMGLVGLIGLEKRNLKQIADRRYELSAVWHEVRSNRQVLIFFLYLVLMLAAVLGQDVLLEPFAARAFGLPVEDTTSITSIWGSVYLVSLIITGFLDKRIAMHTIARAASLAGMAAFGLVAASGFLGSPAMFYVGLVLLGLATGPATVSNLSIMLDMTVPGKVGMFIGAWGSANAIARLLGSLVTAVVRDLVDMLPNSALVGYASAFIVLGAFLGISLLILRRVNVQAFRTGSAVERSSDDFIERTVLANEAG
ncbi:MAG: BCD family MFS transporter [Anaerolineales bacterium]|jgi:BCD family chlorophyll transporter-like MFS transporter|nr:BCD family MFS transporter [Anaerolineales bacterium]